MDTAPLYRRLADDVAGLINAGTLKAGDRIPSVRHLSRQHNVSVPTVLQAYVLLESRRLIESRPRSGYYVRPRLNLAPPTSPVRIPAASSLARFELHLSILGDMADPKFVPMGGAVPSAELLPVAKLARIMHAITRDHPAAAINYDPPPGCEFLRREISRRSIDWGCHIPPEDFVITNGATEAIHLALMAVAPPGSTVMVESPIYYGILNILRQLGLRALAVPADSRTGIDIAAAEQAMRRERITAVLVIPNFSNPSGSQMPEDNRRALLALASKRRIPVIEDNIYGDLNHEGDHRPRCLKALDHADDVILCGSFSKTVAAGYRVGYIASAKYRPEFVRTKTALTLSGASLPAMTIAEYLRSGGYDHHVRRLRRTYRDQVGKMREAVAAAFPAGTRVSDPQGGFVIWVELPRKVDALELFDQARAAGISIAPGHLFSPAREFRNFIRLSCGYPWTPRIENGLDTLGHIAARLAR